MPTTEDDTVKRIPLLMRCRAALLQWTAQESWCLCRWEGTPSENIRILNNTVMHCPYGPHYPAQDIPAIQVFAGDNDPRTTCPVQRNVEIRGNLVMGSLVSGKARLCIPAHADSPYFRPMTASIHSNANYSVQRCR